MSSGIGVNGVPVSTEVDCDVCGEPSRLCGAVEFVGGEWVCETCASSIENHECPNCGKLDSDLRMDEQHLCRDCGAEHCIDADAENPAGTWVC